MTDPHKFEQWLKSTFTRQELNKIALTGKIKINKRFSTREIYLRFERTIWNAAVLQTQEWGYRSLYSMLDYHWENMGLRENSASFQTDMFWVAVIYTTTKMFENESKG